ncbi:MAG: membrane integrity-associated transporter subunit PqiC [Syntrophobacteraceae bacterium]
MSRLTAVTFLCGFLTLAGGCTSAPSRHYTLSPTPVMSPGSSRPDLAIVVGPVTVPELVDRPQIVLRVGVNEVRLDELDRWASSLQDEIAHAVAQNLMARLGTPHVTVAAQGAKSDAAYRVTVAVQRFESALGDSATLDALWTVRRAKEEAARTGRTTVSEPAAGKSLDGVVAAHSRAIGRLSDDIGDAIGSFDRK